MPREDQRVGSGAAGDDAERLDRAGQAAAVVAIDHREGDRAEYVPHDHHVRIPEVDDAVAVRVRGGHREDVHLLAIQMDRDVLAVGEGRQRQRGRSLGQPQPHAVLGHDHQPHAAEVLVAPHVVAVHVGVDHETDVTVGDPADRRQNPVRQRGELVVDHDDAVVADRQSDVASAARDVVHRAAHMVRADLHGVPVHVAALGVHRGHRKERRRQAHQQADSRQCRACHHFLLGAAPQTPAER